MKTQIHSGQKIIWENAQRKIVFYKGKIKGIYIKGIKFKCDTKLH